MVCSCDILRLYSMRKISTHHIYAGHRCNIWWMLLVGMILRQNTDAMMRIHVILTVLMIIDDDDDDDDADDADDADDGYGSCV